mmetsp:Transcript_50985/g.159312  ORF Transcript_50985/g.159312 Transcript_50985/m.159312 type:complete len:105 (+) Transcript_50985:129-443(+)
MSTDQTFLDRSSAAPSSMIQVAQFLKALAGKVLGVSFFSNARTIASALPRGYFSDLPAEATTILREDLIKGRERVIELELDLTTGNTHLSLSITSSRSGYSDPI